MAKKKPRNWSEDRKKEFAERQKTMHRVYADYLTGVDGKGNGLKNLTLGKLRDELNKLIKAGARLNTPVEIYPSCYESPEIVRQIRVAGGKSDEIVTIR